MKAVMGNPCATLPDVDGFGSGSTYQCVVCGHVWEVQFTHEVLVDGRGELTAGSLFEDGDAGLVLDEVDKRWVLVSDKYLSVEQELVVLGRVMGRQRFVRSGLMVSAVLFTVLTAVLLTVGGFEYSVWSGISSFVMFALVGVLLFILIRERSPGRNVLGWKYRKMRSLEDFADPSPWPCLRQDVLVPESTYEGLRDRFEL